jgi:hypothetical protein
MPVDVLEARGTIVERKTDDLTRPDGAIEDHPCDYDLAASRDPKHFANLKSGAQAAA